MEPTTLDIEPLSAGEQLFERARRRGQRPRLSGTRSTRIVPLNTHDHRPDTRSVTRCAAGRHRYAPQASPLRRLGLGSHPHRRGHRPPLHRLRSHRASAAARVPYQGQTDRPASRQVIALRTTHSVMLQARSHGATIALCTAASSTWTSMPSSSQSSNSTIHRSGTSLSSSAGTPTPGASSPQHPTRPVALESIPPCPSLRHNGSARRPSSSRCTFPATSKLLPAS